MTPAPLPPDVLAALKTGRPIDAVRLLREARGIGLKEAHDAIQAFQRDPGAHASIRTAATPKALLTGFLAESLRQGSARKAANDLSAQTGLGVDAARDAVEGLSQPAELRGDLSPGEVPRRGRLLWMLVFLALLAVAVYRWLRSAS